MRGTPERVVFRVFFCACKGSDDIDNSTFVEYNYSTNIEDGRDIDEEYKTASGE